MTRKPDQVDFHCHLDLYPDLATAIAICESSRTATLAVTTTPKAFRRNIQLARSSEFVRVALGLHPHLAEDRQGELLLFEALLPETRYVGEIGLDAGPRYYRSMPTQEMVFRKILSMCATSGGKILSVHSVRTAGRVLDHIDECLPRDRGKVVLHWFSGSAAEASRAVQAGCYFSVNQAMLEKPRGREIVAQLPLDRILTETDGPFVDIDGGPVTPGGVLPTIKSLAALSELATADMANQLIRNWIKLVS
ncbi:MULTISPECIES: Qat anti-phage system TatD family nuclease QatD [unclassified Mesorhizobium]|uniref:Qat anti-phage system TatD family nuclease QatD n=1 Tax=unclassified Mesorhizobium TaxID=325217 RepID=UPI001091FEDC|nr:MULTISPECIES: Qat anti-phage system TatD family nuclease QatD [unclassified Mesorhizobium]TGP93622.1 TatD family deoxyribonuclease [Mesorhizobium sp. M8A.F.Ca.ET.218.01.1.1]TGT17918.1 TatD family deoxyribonuclease [Mesorhizobium sp. M8A.F.Ca.ET.213.01.1.1]